MLPRISETLSSWGADSFSINQNLAEKEEAVKKSGLENSSWTK